MSISRQNLTIVIVTLRSEKVIDRCVKSINKDIPIIVVENSNNLNFKNYLEKNYKNVKCIVSNKNLGTGTGYNIGIKFSKTDYVYVINPDTILETNTLDEIFFASEKLEDFSIISPICSNESFPNYRIAKEKKYNKKSNLPFKVDFVDGYSILINKSKFMNNKYFDESFFMYLENDDLCRRVIKNNGSIFIIPTAKINHLGGSAVDPKFSKEIELSRNWHWMWSKFYYNKKHYGYLNATLKILKNLISAIIKFFYYLVIFNSFKRKIYLMRLSGLLNSMLGNKSFYRPKLDI